ncbi:hypothetical protein ACWDR0_13645 [Streptomyces sp. NPDC003691]
MSLAPRAVLVHSTTEYEQLLARHGTAGQAGFFLSSRGRSLAEVAERHETARRALAATAAAVPLNWRQARVERGQLDRFLFGPEDVVVVVGADGLVANAAKYLGGQPVIGVDPEPGRGIGVLVRHRPGDTARLLASAVSAGAVCDELTMVEAEADDGQRLCALNEIYLGAPGHRTARYRLGSDGPSGGRPAGSGTTGGGKAGSGAAGAGRSGNGRHGGEGSERGTAGAGKSGKSGKSQSLKSGSTRPAEEAQASSGVLVGTGTGATGWLGSLWRERGGGTALPAPTDRRLVWYVREAWPSPATGTSLVEGALGPGERLRLTVESDRLVAFGDGVESDALQLTWGQTVRVGLAGLKLRLLV